MGSLFCCTGLYVLLSAHYVAALQLIGYAGTILLLFTGILILLDLTEDELGEARYTAAKTIGVFAIFVVFTKALRVLAVPIPSDVLADMSAGDMVNFGKADSITTLLFDGFLLPFELISLLLFVSVMGVIAMARLRGRAAI